MNLLFRRFTWLKTIPVPSGWDSPAFLILTKCFDIPTTDIMHVTTRLKQPKPMNTHKLKELQRAELDELLKLISVMQ